jgi:hypothetical protein
MVYHAVQPVKKSSLKSFAAMGNNGQYWVRRMKERDSKLSVSEIIKMKQYAADQLGKNYDAYFNWSDNEIYCSEYIWKIYKNGANEEIGKLKAMKDFDLSSPIVKEIMKKRYGTKLPLDEKMIAPGDIFESPILESVIAPAK